MKVRTYAADDDILPQQTSGNSEHQPRILLFSLSQFQRRASFLPNVGIPLSRITEIE